MTFQTTFNLSEVASSYKPESDNGLQRLLARYYMEPAHEIWDTNRPRWPESFFSIDKSSLFGGLTDFQKQQVLKDCERYILEEIQSIEIAGMAFASRMVLMTNNDQERQLYSFFAADEARHYCQINSVLGHRLQVKISPQSFAGFIGGIIDNETRWPLVFIIQVLLEGWGIHYYSQLAKNTLDPHLQKVLNLIIQDESSHHGSGLLLFNESHLTEKDQMQICKMVSYFLEEIRKGPLSLIRSIVKFAGPLEQNKIEQYLIETDFSKKVAADLHRIKSIIEKAGAKQINAFLTDKGYFKPVEVQSCAQQIFNAINI